jgi:hypothetical protein
MNGSIPRPTKSFVIRSSHPSPRAILAPLAWHCYMNGGALLTAMMAPSSLCARNFSSREVSVIGDLPTNLGADPDLIDQVRPQNQPPER